MNQFAGRDHAGPEQMAGEPGRSRAEASGLRVALVGAGTIAAAHADAIRALGGTVAAVVDPVRSRAEALARGSGAGVFETVAALVDSGAAPRAHVLVPPDLHQAVASPLLKAGIAVLVEKPMAAGSAACRALQADAAAGGAALGVNQNFPFYPAYRRLAAAVRAGQIGRVRQVSCRYHMPLRQLQAQQLSHWMFRTPLNLLLEQAVHPLSQIDDLLGPADAVRVMAAPPRQSDTDPGLVTDYLIGLRCGPATVQMHVTLGESHALWDLSVHGDDGTITADMVRNRIATDRPGRWIDAMDQCLTGLALAGQTARQAAGNLLSYGIGVAGLGGRRDPFFLSMRDSIAAFHRACDAGTPRPDGAQGARLVALCERILAEAGIATDPPARAAQPAMPRPDRVDAAILGGTGFIGRHLVRRLLAADKRVAVLARNVENLPALFDDPRVERVRGAIGDPAAIEDLAGRSAAMINLAHGGGDGRAGVEAAMVGGARLIAEAVLRQHCPQLIYVSSIAALDLDDPKAVVTGATPPSPEPDRRADYARAKALAEIALLAMQREQGLPLIVLRPGVVVGAGTSPFHSGIGFFNRETHCLGWSRGTTPVPLVLAEDVAEAILLCLGRHDLSGRAYNLVGDVRLTARDYIAALGAALQRPLRFHPGSGLGWYADDLAKWGIKRAAGRAVTRPSLTDFRSRGLLAQFDTADVKRDLGWAPEADRRRFLDQAFAGAVQRDGD
ncbi:MAG: NAD-dependent epimerase/dehydratase family protein [Alphaproteobacteria bacterium]|jgi:predicted dehydrogenase/nucleoside-diphosphate-sugar epimerase|nr:NAD-dependent epimerase/dehydratase family protein [Alphaproteobacteria bacterium]